MRSAEDALRSVRRYVASALGAPPWRVRMAMDSRFKRPFAFVSAPPVTRPVSGSGPSTVREDMPVVIQLYPELPTSRTSRGEEARMLAERAAEQVKWALLYGATDATDATVVGARGRIPLWDYTDAEGEWLPLDGPQSVATKRFAQDYLWLPDGWTVTVQPEASEDQLWVAVINLRVQWFKASLLRPTGVVLDAVEIDVSGP